MKKILEKLKSSWVKKDYLRLLLYCILILFGTAIVFFATKGILKFLQSNFETILMVVGGYAFLFYAFYEWRKERREKKEAIIQQQTEQAAEIDRTMAESNYALVRQCLFILLGETANNLHLVKPSTLSELNSPSRIISQSGFTLFQFVVMGDGHPVDTKLVKERLQMRLSQKLTANEFSGITQSNFIYNGRAYPILYIEEVNDTGSFIQVNIAWACEAYCKYLENRALARQQNAIPLATVPRDIDF